LGISLAIGVSATFAQIPQPGQAQLPAPTPESFPKLLESWKTHFERMKQLQDEFPTAVDARKKEIEGQFNGIIAQLQTLEPQLLAAGEVAYRSDTVKYKDAGDFMAEFANEYLNNQQYPTALKLARVLIEKGYDNDGVFNLAGVAAIGIEDYPAAEQYLTVAEQRKKLVAVTADYLRELRMRTAETKASSNPQVLLKTSKGNVVVELYEDQAPNTVANFINLVEKKYYNGLSFHRVLEGFMAQGGDPKGDGTGGPGYCIIDEVKRPDYRMHFRGALSMAKTALPDTAGSQFFICFAQTPHLNQKHTVFGRVVQGMEVVDQLQKIDPNRPEPTVRPDRIVEAVVLRKRNHPYVPQTLPEKN